MLNERVTLLIRVKHNKKGQIGYEAVMAIIRTLMLIFVLLSLILVANVFLVRYIDTRLIESYNLMNLLYYSEKGLALEDAETRRVYPGVVDSGNTAKVDTNFGYNEAKLGPFLAAKATAPLPGGPKEFYYNSELFKDWNFLYLAGLTKGVGGINKVSALKKMRVVQPGSSRTEDVKIEVVSRNA